MGTKDFNALDLIICRWRLRMLRKHVVPGDRVLDFGCGHQALFLRSVQKVITHGVGIDYDANESKPAANIEIRREQFSNRLNCPDGYFDKIAILAVLEHIPLEMITPLLREFHRVLKADGKVLITTPTPAAKPVLEFLAFKLRIISAPEIADHKHYYSGADLLGLARENGYTCTRYHTFQLGMNSLSVFSKRSER